LELRLDPTLKLRLRARAVADKVGMAEVARRAIESYLISNEPPSRREQIRERVHLVDVLHKDYQIPRAVARMYIARGRVKVNGIPTTSFEIEVPRGGLDLEVE
jgi:hypothetical protein